MKYFFTILFIASVLFLSCNNETDKEKDTLTTKDEKGQMTSDSLQQNDAPRDMQQVKEELSNLTPLSPEELKTKVPEQLMDVAYSDADANAAMGAVVATANYKINDSVDLRLEIVDCAGPGGAGMFGMQYLNMIDVNSDDENEYVRTIEFNGGKAFENCRKKKNRCTIAFFSGGRFLVSLRGDNIGIDALKDLAKGLNIK